MPESGAPLESCAECYNAMLQPLSVHAPDAAAPSHPDRGVDGYGNASQVPGPLVRLDPYPAVLFMSDASRGKGRTNVVHPK